MYFLDLFSRIVSDNNKNIGIVFNIKREKYFALLKLHLRALSTRQKSPKQLRIGKMILPKLTHASSKLVSWQVVRNIRPKNKFWGIRHTWFVFFKMKKKYIFIDTFSPSVFPYVHRSVLGQKLGHWIEVEGHKCRSQWRREPGWCKPGWGNLVKL